MDKRKWISVEKKLPPDHEDVLAYSEDGTYFVTCYLDNSGEWDVGDFDKITDWMPLPDGPKS